jgi:hypothetical protein
MSEFPFFDISAENPRRSTAPRGVVREAGTGRQPTASVARPLDVAEALMRHNVLRGLREDEQERLLSRDLFAAALLEARDSAVAQHYAKARENLAPMGAHA